MIRLTSALAFVAVFAVGMPLQAANIAGNPGFEIEGAGGPTDSDLWTATGGGPAGTLSERDSSNPFAGQSAQNLVAIGDDTAGASAGINQNSISDVGLASLQPGTTLQASFEWNSTYGPGGVGNGALRILNSVGAIVANAPFSIGDSSGSYATRTSPQLIVPAFGAAPNDAYAAFLEIGVGAGGFAGSTAQAFVDNVVIDGTTVPEPSSIALVAMAGLGLVVAARRKR